MFFRSTSGGFGLPSVPPVPFGDPPEASDRLRVPPVPFGDPPEASDPCEVLVATFGDVSCLSSVPLARLVGPVGYPYDKPLAVDVLLRQG